MLQRFLSLFSLTAAFFTLAACDGQEAQQDFLADATATPIGYTRTDASGVVGERDEDDWRTAPAFVGIVRVEPAFPNPTANGFVTVIFSVTQSDQIIGGVELYARDPSGRLLQLARVLDSGLLGVYELTFAPSELGQSGLQRLFIADGQGQLISYGDLLVQ